MVDSCSADAVVCAVVNEVVDLTDRDDLWWKFTDLQNIQVDETISGVIIMCPGNKSTLVNAFDEETRNISLTTDEKLAKYNEKHAL